MLKLNTLGGSYSSVRKANQGTNQEAHHLIACSSAQGVLSRGEGVVIEMTEPDHQKTASWGRRKNSQAFRQKQRELVAKGKPEQAFKLGIDDVRTKFGNKYDAHIKQAEAYWKQQQLAAKCKAKVNQIKQQNITPSNPKLDAIKKTPVANAAKAQTPKPLDQKLGNLKASVNKPVSPPPSPTPKNTPKIS